MNKLGKVITNTNMYQREGDRKTEAGRLKISRTDVFLGAKKRLCKQRHKVNATTLPLPPYGFR